MVSDNGHLVFTTGDNKEIRFQTSASGRVKVGNEDLTELLSQVSFLLPAANILLLLFYKITAFVRWSFQ